MERTLKVSLFVIGAASLVFFHLFQLAEIPGLHYDEAWAMNYSWRIASEPGFWPWAAMSPYTAPWAHYWSALWMKLLGPSLLVFRGSQVSLSLAGLAALTLALPRSARFLFPWTVLLIPGLLLNHRFAIELTGLHVLAFGLLCLGLSRRWWLFAAVAALVGTTAHILFYGVALGLFFASCCSNKLSDKKSRIALAAYFALMTLFFLQVLLAIPEKGKAGALVASALGASITISAGWDRWSIWRSAWWERALPILSAVFVFNALFFGLGIWTASVYTGWDLWPQLRLSLTTFPFLLLAVGIALFLSVRKRTAFERSWFLAAIFAMGLMMLKPAPRYFELVLLGMALCFSLSWSSWLLDDFPQILRNSSGARKFSIVLCFALFIGLLIKIPSVPITMLMQSKALGAQESDLRFLFFKDSSRDFLDKQSLVKFLGSSGCKFSDIETHDPRLLEALKALSLGDWQTDDKKICPFAYVARRTEDGASGDRFMDFRVRRKSWPK